jgi:protein SCO1/2
MTRELIATRRECTAQLKASLTAALAALALSSTAAAADDHAHEHHQHHQHHSAPAGDDEPSNVNVKLRDLVLVDQHGRQASFRRDVIGERIVVINFVYTSCTTVCPVASAIFAQVQQNLGERVGDEVVLVSLSVDPVNDRPARLQAYAQKHNAGDGWLWLTGEKPSMDQVLQGLGAYTPNYQDHPAMVLVGDGNSGQWTRLFGFPGPDKIITEVDALAAVRARSTSAAVDGK